jgi:hypothetical protein
VSLQMCENNQKKQTPSNKQSWQKYKNNKSKKSIRKYSPAVILEKTRVS